MRFKPKCRCCRSRRLSVVEVETRDQSPLEYNLNLSGAMPDDESVFNVSKAYSPTKENDV